MAAKDKIKESYQLMIDWNVYRLEQNNQSLVKLNELLSKLDRSGPADEIYETDIVELDSLKMIYETSIRNFEGQIQKYRDLMK